MSVSLVPSVRRVKSNVVHETTDGALVTAVAGNKVRVLGVNVVAGGTATLVTFNSKPSGAGAAVSAAFSLGANGVLTLPIHEDGWFETSGAEGLSVTTGTGSTCAVTVIYTLLPA